MIWEIIKENLEYRKIKAKEASLITGISERTIRDIINNKVVRYSDNTLLAFDNLFGFERGLLYKQYQSFQLLNNKRLSEYVDHFDKMTNTNESKTNFYTRLVKIFKTEDIDQLEKRLNDNKFSFSRHDDTVEGRIWLSILIHKYGDLKPNNEFNKKQFNKVYNQCIKIMNKNDKFDNKYIVLEKYLSNHGIILKNAPSIINAKISAVSHLKSAKQKIIFMSDLGKREYRYLFHLLHELVHIYEPNKFTEKGINNFNSKNILKIKSESSVFDELIDSIKTFDLKDNDKWDALRLRTNNKIHFGEFSQLLIKEINKI